MFFFAKIVPTQAVGIAEGPGWIHGLAGGMHEKSQRVLLDGFGAGGRFRVPCTGTRAMVPHAQGSEQKQT